MFGVFEPKREGLIINFLNNNSANFDGLGKLEDLIKLIGPPKWPWLVDTNLAAQGKVIFERPTVNGGCVECHGISPGKVRLSPTPTWATPIQNVGTDTREYDIMAWTAKTGVLQGTFIPRANKPLKAEDQAFNILATSVIGSIAEQVLRSGAAPSGSALVATALDAHVQSTQDALDLSMTRLPPALRDLESIYHPTMPAQDQPGLGFQGKTIPDLAAPAAPPPSKGSYEARVMQGIWAAAPYLHNGSVPTLAELLKPAAERVKQFKIGPAYDNVNIGLAVEQTQFDATITTTDCGDLNSGNSHCGHEFGTQLPDAEKKALLEYLKTL